MRPRESALAVRPHVALGGQMLVRRGDGVPGNGQRLGQRSRAGQPAARHQAAIEDGALQALVQLALH
jgi:hypothetical protein